MKVSKEEYLPNRQLERDQMKQLQVEIGQEAVFEDSIGFESEDVYGKVVLGVDQAFLEGKAVSGVIALRNGEIVEKQYGVSDLEMPYIPGLLSFREAPPIIKALEKLSLEPELVFFDGSGRIHYRQAGIATHLGVLFNVASVGVAKNLLCGKPGRSLDRKLEEGEKVPILSDESVNAPEGEVIGYAFQSRQYENSESYINPLYISSGHKISASTAVEITGEFCETYKLPEPTRLADQYVDEVKKQLE